MKKYILIVFEILIASSILAQNHIIAGDLIDSDGYPIIGASVYIQGTTIGAVTDIEGHYSIEAPSGAIIAISTIGYETRFYRVTDDGNIVPYKNNSSTSVINNSNNLNSQNETSLVNQKINSPDNYTEDTTGILKNEPENGIAVMDDNSTFVVRNLNENENVEYLNYRLLRFIKSKQNNKNTYLVFDKTQWHHYYLPKIDFHTSLSLEVVNKLPLIQQSYAQGRIIGNEAIWRGSETGEILSWGPAFKDIEYDGTEYAYDTKGRLVRLWQGNNTSVIPYNSYDLFNSGHTFTNYFRIRHQIQKIKYFISFKNSTQQGIIPLSKFVRNTFNTGISYHKNRFKLESNLNISKAEGNNTFYSPLGYYLMRSVILTAPSFDNSNGFGENALNRKESFLLSDNTQRSYSNGTIDNPYWLMNNSKDDLNNKNINGSIDIFYDLKNRMNLHLISRLEEKSNSYKSGIRNFSNAFSNGIFSNEDKQIHNLSSAISLNKNLSLLNDMDFITSVSYNLFYEEAEIKNLDATYYNPEIIEVLYTDSYTYRNKHLTQTVNFYVNGVIDNILIVDLKAFRNWYKSSGNDFEENGGSIAGAFRFSELWHNHNFIENSKLRISYGSLFNSIPVYFDGRQYSSLRFSDNSLNNFFLSENIEFNKNLKSEETRMVNIGYDMAMFSNKLLLNMDIYIKNVYNSIFNILSDDHAFTDNVAELSTKGFEMSLQHNMRYNAFNFNSELSVFTYKTKVTKLYKGYDQIPLSGFSTIYSAAIPEKPLGVLIGSKYLRDTDGNKIIGDNGFPLVDPELGIIGDPNPDWTASLENSVSFKSLELSWMWEIKYGGKIWNGTLNAMNYYGISEESANLRNTRNYIFNGVKQDGTPNDIEVDFANPNNGMEGNYWINYGMSGVAEEAIEDATSLRLREVTLIYNIPNHLVGILKLKYCSIILYGKNLLLITKYKGVDPESSLFGQPAGYGLDYFNLPSTKSFGLSMKLGW